MYKEKRCKAREHLEILLCDELRNYLALKLQLKKITIGVRFVVFVLYFVFVSLFLMLLCAQSGLKMVKGRSRAGPH